MSQPVVVMYDVISPWPPDTQSLKQSIVHLFYVCIIIKLIYVSQLHSQWCKNTAIDIMRLQIDI